MEASVLVAHWNTPPPQTILVWPNPKSFARASGQASMSMRPMEASDFPRLNPISLLGSCPVPATTALPSRHPRKPSRQRSRPKLVVIFSAPPLRSTTDAITFASIAFLELARGFLQFRTPSSPTFLTPCFGSAFVVASACPSGPRTRTARSVDKSWTNGATTPRFPDAVMIGSLATILESWSQPGHCPGKAGLLDPLGNHRRRSPPGS